MSAASDRTTRYRVEPGIYFRLTAAGRKLMAEKGVAPEKVPAGHRVYVLGIRDSAGRQRWKSLPPNTTLTEARQLRAELSAAKGKGKLRPNPKLTFGEAAKRWLDEDVSDTRPTTQATYRYAVEHLVSRWGKRRMDSIDVGDAKALVRELRAAKLGEWTIAGAIRAGNRVFRFAASDCNWHGENPFPLLRNGQRARLSETPERRIYTPAELEQTLAASWEPYRTLLRVAAVVGARESELLGLWWRDLDLSDPAMATVRFTHQVDRRGERVPLKTEESKALLPLPRSTAALLLQHRARSPHAGPQAFVFCTRTGRALSQRNVLRALYTAQERARTPEGCPTFPELYEHDERGHLAADEDGAYVLRKVPRRQLPPLPDFHALRHTAAMECEDAEEARDLLRHKNSVVTRTVYRAHFNDRRREALRAKLEARASAAESAAPSEPQAPPPSSGEVLLLRRAR